MSKSIISVGILTSSPNIENVSLESTSSLLDWDIIIFRPDIEVFLEWREGQYMGKSSLSDHGSVAILEAANHWRRELEVAVAEGKTIFAFLSAPESVYIATGEKKYSGSGRNQKTTRIVTDFNSYSFMPVPNDWTIAEGSSIRLDPRSSDLLGSYWNTFSSGSKYNVYWEKNSATACLHTKMGNRPVGFKHSDPRSGGVIFFLPDLNFSDPEFTTYDEENDNEVWTQKGLTFFNNLVQELVNIDKKSAAFSEKSAEPHWAALQEFELPNEQITKSSILEMEGQVQKLQQKIDLELSKLKEITGLRDLLFESGKPLEFSIIKALEVLGFSAENYDDGVSEFDVVFTCPEGRLLGEAEGKDNKAINITKIRQLSTNVLEDLDREEVSVPAKGVLFGNAFRFQAPQERTEHFTEKCIATAQSVSIALVATPDLFRVAKHLLENNDPQYAKQVRLKILSTNGTVKFDFPDALAMC